MPGQARQYEKIAADGSVKQSSLYRAQTRQTLAKAEQEELKLKQIKGSLILRETADRLSFNAMRRVRDKLLNLPARLAGILAAESDQQKVFALLTKEIHQVLEGLTDGHRRSAKS